MRDVVRVCAIGAALGVLYGALVGIAVAVASIVATLPETDSPPLDILAGGAAMALFLSAYGMLFGLTAGAPYGLATGIVVLLARRYRSRWSPLVAALVVLALGQLALPGRFTGDAPLFSTADPTLDDLVQSLMIRSIPAAIAAFIAWRATREARQSSGAIAIG